MGYTAITIPNSVTKIGSGTFSGCTGLKEITIPLTVREMGQSVFDGCSSTTISNSKQIKTGIIGALAEEVTLLKEKMSDIKTTTISGMEFCERKDRRYPGPG